jgi:hypothetical protein
MNTLSTRLQAVNTHYALCNFANCGKNVNDFSLDEFLRGTGD